MKMKKKVTQAILAAALIAPAVAVSPAVDLPVNGLGVQSAEAAGNGKALGHQKQSQDIFERGNSLFGLAHKAVKKQEPVAIKLKGKVIGYVIASEEKTGFGKLISFKFVSELPKNEVPAEESAVEKEQPVEEAPAEEPTVEEEQPVEEAPAEEPTVEEEQPVEEAPVEEPTVEEEQPVEETPVEEPTVEEEQPVEEPTVEEEQPVEETPVEEPAVEEEQPVEDDLSDLWDFLNREDESAETEEVDGGSQDSEGTLFG